MDIDILPVPRPSLEDHSNKKIPSPLPTMHTLFVGKTGSGKSNLIVNMISRKAFGYNRFYKKIIIISPTLSFDDTWELFSGLESKKGRAAFELIDPQDDANIVLESILEQSMAQPVKTLCVLDDCLSLLKNSPILSQLFTTARHYKLHLWVSTQSFRQIPKTVRNNTSDYILFNGSTRSELKTIHEDVGDIDKQQFFKLYDDTTQKPYSFLQIRTRAPFEKRYTASFKRFVTI